MNKLTANYHEFEERIGYKFNNIAYLLQALTHASYQYNQVSYIGILSPLDCDRSKPSEIVIFRLQTAIKDWNFWVMQFWTF